MDVSLRLVVAVKDPSESSDGAAAPRLSAVIDIAMTDRNTYYLRALGCLLPLVLV